MNIPNTQVNDRNIDRITDKWSKILDYSSDAIPAIQNEHVYRSTAMLLENQEQWCIQESNIAASGGVFGATSNLNTGLVNGDGYATGDARLPKILIPMIRRTFPELISNEICGVQPMAGPVGLAFALRYAYQSDVLGTGVDGKTSPVGSPNLRNPHIDYDGSADLPGSEIGYQLLDTRFTGTSSQQLTGQAGVWTFADQDRGVAELLANYELTGNIPQIELKFEKTAVEAGTRRLATRWAVELEQDIKNMNGIDIDGELTNAMSYEIQAEIDREVVMRMIQAAFNGGYGAGYSFWSPVSADGRWQGERTATFYTKLIVEANRVAIRNRRGAANFIVATPRVCAMLESLDSFKFYEVAGSVSTAGVGITKVGTVGSRFTVYRDTRTEVQNNTLYSPNYYTNQTSGVEYALMGYKGSEYYDTGIIYCPYIPIMVQRTIGPNDFAPRVGMMTRYGIVNNIFGAELYYHLIVVKGLGVAFTPGTQSAYF